MKQINHEKDHYIEDTRSTVLIEIRRHDSPNLLHSELGRIPAVGEHILFSDQLFLVTHILHVDNQPYRFRIGSHTPTGTEYRANGRVAAAVYVNTVSQIDGVSFSHIGDLEPH